MWIAAAADNDWLLRWLPSLVLLGSATIRLSRPTVSVLLILIPNYLIPLISDCPPPISLNGGVLLH